MPRTKARSSWAAAVTQDHACLGSDHAEGRQRVRRIIDEQYGVARKILEDNRARVEVMTSALLEWETIDADQIDDIVNDRPPRPPKTPQGPSDTVRHPAHRAGCRRQYGGRGLSPLLRFHGEITSSAGALSSISSARLSWASSTSRPTRFSGGGELADTDSAIRPCAPIDRRRAHILDLGGESTRPGAPAGSAAEELARILPLIEGLRDCAGVPLSIDTFQAGSCAPCSTPAPT